MSYLKHGAQDFTVNKIIILYHNPQAILNEIVLFQPYGMFKAKAIT